MDQIEYYNEELEGGKKKIKAALVKINKLRGNEKLQVGIILFFSVLFTYGLKPFSFRPSTMCRACSNLQPRIIGVSRSLIPKARRVSEKNMRRFDLSSHDHLK